MNPPLLVAVLHLRCYVTGKRKCKSRYFDVVDVQFFDAGTSVELSYRCRKCGVTRRKRIVNYAQTFAVNGICTVQHDESPELLPDRTESPTTATTSGDLEPACVTNPPRFLE